MSIQYCKDHPRVELIGGKCVACGEIKIKVKKSDSINMQVAKLTLIPIAFFLIVLIVNLAKSR